MNSRISAKVIASLLSSRFKCQNSIRRCSWVWLSSQCWLTPRACIILQAFAASIQQSDGPANSDAWLSARIVAWIFKSLGSNKTPTSLRVSQRFRCSFAFTSVGGAKRFYKQLLSSLNLPSAHSMTYSSNKQNPSLAVLAPKATCRMPIFALLSDNDESASKQLCCSGI